jgi:hypothetical protein
MDAPSDAERSGRDAALILMLKMIFGMLEDSDPRYATATVRQAIDENLAELIDRPDAKFSDAAKKSALDLVADVFGAQQEVGK